MPSILEKLYSGSRIYRTAKIWFSVVMVIVFASFLIFPKSLDSNMALFIWIISGIAVLYRARKLEKAEISPNYKKLCIILGISMCLLSFISVPIGFTNPPYSIGEFSILLVGITFIIFAFLEFKPLLFPSSFPLIAILGYTIFDLLHNSIDAIAAPMIPPVVIISVFVLNLLGINATYVENIISYTTANADLMRVSIVSDCTGIWSLGAFAVAVLAVLSIFPKIISKKILLFVAIGFIGTYIANLIRVLLICLSGYYYGYSGVTQMMHVELGWIAFSIWMGVFWYIFFSKFFPKK